VIGEVRLPGWYNVSSLHTALQVLTMAGGVKDIGSLRRIEVRRGNQVVETIDLYDFLLKGETGADTRLLSGDTVFVPVVGKLAALTGEVKRPAIYELGREKTVLDLIRMAGGFTPSAFKRRVQVERLERHDAKIVLDVDADDLEKSGKAFDLSDGDIVRVLPIVKVDINAVALEGNVVRPGKYELKPGMTVGALLPDVNVFLPETYFDYALLTRLVPPDFHKEVVPVNLRRIVLEKRPEADIPLQAGDTLTVYNRSAFRDLPKATISGEVRMTRRELAQAPKSEQQATVGKAALEAKTSTEIQAEDVLTFDIQAGVRAADLVKMAGGLTRLAALDRAEIVRVDDDRTYRTIYFDLGKAMEGDPKENLLLESEDHVRIHSVMETRYRKTVTAVGEVNNPADYVLTQGMALSDLLFKAGGFRENAYTKEGS
jgi:protein involved in polysaccharide export with SLBB domain